MRPGFSIRTLLIGAHAFVWLVPLFGLSLLRIYDVYLLRQTEHQLIAEAVMVGEALRDAVLHEQGRAGDDHLPPRRGPRDTFEPIAAQVDFDTPTLPPGPEEFPLAPQGESPLARAGKAIEPLLRRAQSFNLSGVRVLDARGCVVATTRGEQSRCMGELPEVKGALLGNYTAVLRERNTDSPTPPLGDVRRRGHVRVFIALPVFSDGRVLAVVRASRTGLDALSSLWANRKGLLWLGASVLAILALIALGSSAAIVRPLRRLTAAAQRVASGTSASELALTGTAPREIAELQAVLGGMARELEARAGYVREFASQVSHELKTPITAIRGAAELLRHGLDDMPPADRARFLANIEDDAQRMERLVARLIELARAENRVAGETPEVDAVAIARALSARHPRVEFHAPPVLPLAMGPDELESVLGNLLDNALRHGRDLPVQLTLAREGARVRIEVTDRGPGVSEANRKRLFERFFTTERDRGGTGLGLAIVKARAEARGGSVDVAFDERGTTFTVVL